MVYDIILWFVSDSWGFCRGIHPGSGQNEQDFCIHAICVTFFVSTFTMFVFLLEILSFVGLNSWCVRVSFTLLYLINFW